MKTARRDSFALMLAFGAISSSSACSGQDVSNEPTAPAVDTGHPPSPKPPSNIVGGFKIEVPPMTLAPGEEKTPCWIFPLELTGPSHIVGGGSVTVGPGMHHGNITTRKKTGDGVRECTKADDSAIGGEAGDIIGGGAVLFGSSTQVSGTEWQSFPDGMGYRVKDGFEIVARMHYLNVSSEPLTVAPVYEWYTIDESKMTQEIGPFAWVYRDFSIPPKSEFTVEADCSFPAPMHLVNVLPHMHKLGTSFTASYLGGKLDGKMFLESRGYDPDNGVMVQYDSGVDLSQGDGASFSCTWKNTFDKTIGEGIGDNEMCILFGYAYPPENAFTVSASGSSCIYVAPPSP